MNEEWRVFTRKKKKSGVEICKRKNRQERKKEEEGEGRKGVTYKNPPPPNWLRIPTGSVRSWWRAASVTMY